MYGRTLTYTTHLSSHNIHRLRYQSDVPFDVPDGHYDSAIHYTMFLDSSHHETLPAWIFDLTKDYKVSPASSLYYRLNGKKHRWNGPAMEYVARGIRAYGGVQRSWHLYDRFVNPIWYFKFLDESGIDINNLTMADKLLITIWMESFD